MTTSRLTEIFEKNGFSVTQIADELICVNNFFSEAEMDFIWDRINSAKEEDWQVEYRENLKTFCMQKFGRDDVENLVAEGKFEITQNWFDKNLNISNTKEYQVYYERLNSMVKEALVDLDLSGMATIQRMQPGVELKSHTDQHTDPSIKYATIAYINDDYVDGELFFKKLGISLRPSPRSLLIFPGNEEYEHGVDFVGEGPIRYVIVGFIKELDHYERNRY